MNGFKEGRGAVCLCEFLSRKRKDGNEQYNSCLRNIVLD